MSDNLNTRPATAPQTRASGRETQALLRPPADIFEDADGITLLLDMPGVVRDRVTIQADRNTLAIDGDMQIAMPQGMEALYAEVHATHYRRSFTLSGELDPDKIEANLADGVLTVRIPKRAELRPRTIEVKVA
jgi:HSP20 family molecular chaperone IbpA